MSKSISALVLEYFEGNQKKNIQHAPVVDWVTEEYLKDNPEPPRDIWRAIRKLHQEGILVKVKKGIYRYDPEFVKESLLLEFPIDVKEEIFKRDNYQCVVCAQGRKDGVEICADHIKPKDRSGDNSIENGQTLCTKHNLIKKNYSQTEAGKKYFIKIYRLAIINNDSNMIKFCADVFDVYDKHNIDGHIKRPDGDIK